MPEISIIVPVYKVENYIDECVKSLVSQTFKDIEIILVDDGSPDNCGKICDDFAEKDGRIRVIHQQNGGLSNARNTGISEARGNYICFVDSDDYIMPDYCQTLYDMLNGTSYDFSVCEVHRFEDGNFSVPDTTNETKTYNLSNINFLNAQIQKKSEFGVWNKLYKKYVFEKIKFADGRLNEDVIWSGDLAANFTNGVICTDKNLYCYRQRAGGIVSQQSAKGSVDRIFAGTHLIDTVLRICPDMTDECTYYALSYPWMFVDSIAVHRRFSDNKEFLDSLQAALKKYGKYIKISKKFSDIQKHRMMLFAKSRLLFYINAYIRLIRVYIYRIIRKDPYKSGHGI